MKNEKRDLKPFIRQWFKYLFLGIFLALLGFIIVFALFAFTPYFKVTIQFTEFISEDVILSFTNNSGNKFIYVVGAILSVIVGITGIMSFYVLIPGLIILISLGYSLSMTAKRKNIWCAIMYAHEENVGKEHKKRKSGDEWLKDVGTKRRKKKEDPYYERFKRGYYGKMFEEQERAREEAFRNESYNYYNSYNSDESYSSSQQESCNSTSEFEKMDEEKKMVEALRAFGFESSNFTKAELTKKYRELLKKFHPDANPGIDTTEATRSIQEKYEFLKEHIKQ